VCSMDYIIRQGGPNVEFIKYRHVKK
jgi:hypothetical protein